MSRNAKIAGLLSVIPLTLVMIYLGLALRSLMAGKSALECVIKPIFQMLWVSFLFILGNATDRHQQGPYIMAALAYAVVPVAVCCFGIMWLVDRHDKKAMAQGAASASLPEPNVERIDVGDTFD